MGRVNGAIKAIPFICGNVLLAHATDKDLFNELRNLGTLDNKQLEAMQRVSDAIAKAEEG